MSFLRDAGHGLPNRPSNDQMGDLVTIADLPDRPPRRNGLTDGTHRRGAVSFDCHRLCKVARAVDVVAEPVGDFTGEVLQGDDRLQRTPRRFGAR